MKIDENTKLVNITMTIILTFYEEPPKSKETWGSDDIKYEIYYNSQKEIMQIFEIGGFGDATLVKTFRDRRGRGITIKEMLENIKEMTEMTYREFKEKILNKEDE